MGGPGSGGQNKTAPETEARVLGHVTEHPGLSAYLVGRAVGMSARTTEEVLFRLAKEGQVRCEDERYASSPSGWRRLWYSGEKTWLW